MLTKYIEAEKRFLEIEHLLNDTTDDAHKQQLIDECTALKPLAEAYRTYQKYVSELDYAKDLAESCDDVEMCDLALTEVDILSTRIDDQLHEMKVLLLPKDPRDSRHIFIEIRTDGYSEEIRQYCDDFFKMYVRYIEARKWKSKMIIYSDKKQDDLITIVLLIEERDIYQYLKFEYGIHQIILDQNAESSTPINISIDVFAEDNRDDVQLDMNDVEVQVFRVRGTGGISDSGVRMTHIPTGIVVDMQDRRSQILNKRFAEKLLFAKVYRLQNEQIDSVEIVRTYTVKQDMVIDHRLGGMKFSMSNLINGGLHQIINPLVKQDQLRLFREHNL